MRLVPAVAATASLVALAAALPVHAAVGFEDARLRIRERAQHAVHEQRTGVIASAVTSAVSATSLLFAMDVDPAIVLSPVLAGDTRHIGKVRAAHTVTIGANDALVR